MPISRMQQPRQQYGLGSFVKKAFKGVTKGIKKFAKSDLGKAALLAGGAYFAPTLFGGKAGFGNFGSMLKSGIGSLASKLPSKEAIQDINNPSTPTKQEDVTRSVKIKVAAMPPLGASSKEL